MLGRGALKPPGYVLALLGVRCQHVGEDAHQHEQHDDDGAEQAQRLLPDHPVKEVRKWPASASPFGADAAGVPAQCRQVMGTIHVTEIFPIAAPEVSRETARSIADFCRGTTRRE